MGYPKTREIDAAYQCSHTLHLTKTVNNESEEECFVCWMYDAELCPECRQWNRARYSHVYNMLEDTRYDGYRILFKRNDVVRGNRLWEEWVWNSPDSIASTIFLVENDINHHYMWPVGMYKGDHYVPFAGFTVDYMRWLLKHNEEAVQKEGELENLQDAMRKESWGV